MFKFLLFLLGSFLCACGLRPDKIPGAHKDLKREFISSGDFQLSFLRAERPDSKIRLLLIHGTPGNADMWQNYLLKAPDGVEVLAVDRVGFGESTKPEKALTVIEQAATLYPLLSDTKKNIILGHSLGGPIALALGALFPERANSLVILAGSADPKLEKPRWFNWLASTWLAKAVLSNSWNYSNDEMYLLEAGLEELALRMPQITAPVLIVQGQRDKLVLPKNADFMEARLKASKRLEVVRLPEGNHFLPWGQEELVRESIKKAIVAID